MYACAGRCVVCAHVYEDVSMRVCMCHARVFACVGGSVFMCVNVRVCRCVSM